jgi:hypothetical protein
MKPPGEVVREGRAEEGACHGEAADPRVVERGGLVVVVGEVVG